MISKEEVRELLKSTETYRFERTTSTGDMDKFQEAICAFSNDLPNSKKNGYLILGAYDNGTLSGLKVDDDLLKQISAEIMERLGLKHRYNVKHRYIDPLIEGGCGVMTIPEKPNSRDQKYKRALT